MMEEGRAGPSHGGQPPNAELLLGPDPQHARPRQHKPDCFDYFCRCVRLHIEKDPSLHANTLAIMSRHTVRRQHVTHRRCLASCMQQVIRQTAAHSDSLHAAADS